MSCFEYCCIFVSESLDSFTFRLNEMHSAYHRLSGKCDIELYILNYD